MHLGYARTLQATDLWKLDDSRSAGTLSAKLDASWTRRTADADAYNQRLAAGEIKPSAWQRAQWTLTGHRAAKEAAWREHDGRQTPSLAWALNDVFGWAFWSAGLFKVVGDTSQLMAPLVIRTLIRYAQAHGHGDTANIGSGVGMAIGLFLLTVTASVCQHQFFWRSMTTGVLARAALIASLYKRGVHLTPKARTQIPHAALVNHVSLTQPTASQMLTRRPDLDGRQPN
jgi:ATP-binding cassette subfamily C (CFTR/MRP) protein 1